MVGVADPLEDASARLDARPIIARRRRRTPGWMYVALLAFAGSLLFLLLENARQTRLAEPQSAPATSAQPEVLPELILPKDYVQASPRTPQGSWVTPYSQPAPRPARSSSATFASPRSSPPRVIQNSARPSPTTQPYNAPLQASEYPLPPPPAPALAPPRDIDRPGGSSTVDRAGEARTIQASRTINPATTILQGSIIRAVLENALDSTSPGQVRAMITKDAYSADGSRVLIPRGSRLYGTYQASLSQGQKRLQVRWTRLVRPDMVSLALDSPAADPLGRAGIGGKVNSHFLTRLGNTLLNSTLSLGSLLASRNAPIVIAVPPGGTSQVTQQVGSSSGSVRPTLTVRQGTRVSVFVQHDLSFASVEGLQ